MPSWNKCAEAKNVESEEAAKVGRREQKRKKSEKAGRGKAPAKTGKKTEKCVREYVVCAARGTYA
jgi:hypothetical protein